MDIGQLRVGKGYLMVTVGQQGYLQENLTELHIIVRTTGFKLIETCKIILVILLLYSSTELLNGIHPSAKSVQ